MLNETCINCFLSLAQTLNFTKTASLMSFSQQAVSQMISRMERDMGVHLFIRSNHHVAITPAGREFYEFFSKYKEEYLQLCARTKARYAEVPHAFNAGYQNWIDHGLEAKIAFEDIRQVAPKLDIFVSRRSPGGLVQGLLNRELDLAVMYGRWAPSLNEIRITKLLELELVLLVSADHPLATDDAVYTDFFNEPFIIDTFENESAAAAKRRLKSEVSLLGFTPREVITMRDREAVYTTVELGAGIALSSSIARVVRSYHVRAYPTGIKENLICAWHWTDGNELLEQYVQCLQNAYRKTGRAPQKGSARGRKAPPAQPGEG
jgi:DNA-binding transcriptional LysR family regulator